MVNFVRMELYDDLRTACVCCRDTYSLLPYSGDNLLLDTLPLPLPDSALTSVTVIDTLPSLELASVALLRLLRVLLVAAATASVESPLEERLVLVRVIIIHSHTDAHNVNDMTAHTTFMSVHNSVRLPQSIRQGQGDLGSALSSSISLGSMLCLQGWGMDSLTPATILAGLVSHGTDTEAGAHGAAVVHEALRFIATLQVSTQDTVLHTATTRKVTS